MSDKPERALLDTTVFIANESGRQIDRERFPEEVAISIVTRAELRAGILAAESTEIRDRRLATFEALRELEVLPIWGPVDRAWSGMRAYLAASGRRVDANDLWIAATAAAYQIPVITRDADFNALSGVMGLAVIEV